MAGRGARDGNLANRPYYAAMTKVPIELPTFCATCGGEIATPSTNSEPCPDCGSLTRLAVVRKLPQGSKLVVVAGDGKPRKSPQELRYERSLHRATGEPHRVVRFFDRVGGRYAETIVNEKTGDTVRHVREPLNQHRNRGDAKPKKK
jgi:predicted RNA-binding Zn-ribbon protein involved in translation (DUF1610 family)